MSSIAPNGQIRFLTNIPIDSNYENSLDFQNELEQRTYFLNQNPVHTQIGATRVRDGVISVNKLSDELLSANYLMFQNLNFSTKWFYAFITDVEYINNNMSYVYYQIDDIQTWMFDVQLTECIVEREHTSTDGLFEHLVDEGIGTNEYITVSGGSKTYTDYVAILYTSVGSGFNVSGTYAPCQITNGNAKALTGYVFDLQDNNGEWLEIRNAYSDVTDTDVQDLIVNSGNGLEKLNLYTYLLTTAQAKDSIVGIVAVPKFFVGSVSDIRITQKDAKTDNMGFTNFASGEALDKNYVPKNKKLYNAPYSLIDIVTTDGQTIHLQPEFLQEGNNLVNILSSISVNPSITIVPKNYMNNEYAWEKAISYDGFPQIAVSIDGYSAWVASGGLKQWNNQLYSHISNGIAGGLSSTLTENPVGLVSSAVGTYLSVVNDFNKLEVAKALPPEVKGNADSSPLMSNKMMGITYRKLSLKKDVLVSIDNFFTMFGYKVNKLKQPTRRNRPHFTYLKTKGCHVNGGAPADAIQRIETIYDNGIRFWVNPAEVGNYEVNNAPT